MAPFPSSPYPSLGGLTDEEWGLSSHAPGSLSLENSSQAPWQVVPTEGKALGMTNMFPRPLAARGGLPDPCLWPPPISLCQEAFGKVETKRKVFILHCTPYSDLGFSTTRNQSCFCGSAIKWWFLSLSQVFHTQASFHLSTRKHTWRHTHTLCFFSNFVFSKCLLCKKKLYKLPFHYTISLCLWTP